MSDKDAMNNLAATAELHAAERMGRRLQIDTIDEILDAATSEIAGAASDLAENELLPLEHCYGAWLGMRLIELGGHWFAMDEPVSPRVELSGYVLAPFDAVRRALWHAWRLAASRAPVAAAAPPTIAELYVQARRLCGQNRNREWANRVFNVPAVDELQVEEANRRAWNELAADHRFVAANAERLDAHSARQQLDPWLRDMDLAGARVLCLAAGGGLHAPLLALAGAQVTVVDFAESMLAIDAKLAGQLSLPINIQCKSLLEWSEQTRGSSQPDRFDVVVQPVSTCYLPELSSLYSAIHRVLIPGGLYLSQHKQPSSLLVSGWSADGGYRMDHPARVGYPLPNAVSSNAVSSGTMRSNASLPQREAGTTEYAHSLDALLGAMCRAGFAIEDFTEPARSDYWAAAGTAGHLAHFISPYLKIKAVRRE